MDRQRGRTDPARPALLLRFVLCAQLDAREPLEPLRRGARLRERPRRALRQADVRADRLTPVPCQLSRFGAHGHGHERLDRGSGRFDQQRQRGDPRHRDLRGLLGDRRAELRELPVHRLREPDHGPAGQPVRLRAAARRQRRPEHREPRHPGVHRRSGSSGANAFQQGYIDRYGYLVDGTRVGGGRVGGGAQLDNNDFYRQSYQGSYDRIFGEDVTHAFHIGYQWTQDEEDLLRSSNGWGTVTIPGGTTICPANSSCAGQPDLLPGRGPAAGDHAAERRAGAGHSLGVRVAEPRAQRHHPLGRLHLQCRPPGEQRQALRPGL